MNRISSAMTWHQRIGQFFNPTPSTIFSLRFIIACTVLFALLEIMPDPFFFPVNRLNAILAGRLLAVLGMHPEVQGLVIVLDGFQAQVIGECSAVFISVLPIAFIFAYPSDWRQKTAGWLAGLALLFTINLVRIAALVYTGARAPQCFELVHLYMGQPAMILVVLGICLGWVQWLRRGGLGFRLNTILARCLAVSILGFFFWFLLGEPYSRLLYHILKILLAVFNMTIQVPETLHVYPDTFQCVNVVSFSALFWGFGRGRLQTRIVQWLSGVSGLMIAHLLFKLLQILFFQHHQQFLMGIINILLVLNEWILPFGLWVLVERQALFKNKG